MRLAYWSLAALTLLLLLGGALAWRLAVPVHSDPNRWKDHAGPVLEVVGSGRGLVDLDGLETTKDEEPWRFTMPGSTERHLRFPKALDLRGFGKLAVPLHLKGGHRGMVLVSVRLIHHNGWIYETWKQARVERGGESVLQIDMRPSSSDFSPVGHGRPWDGESARAVVQLNLRVRSPRAFKGRLAVGKPKLHLPEHTEVSSKGGTAHRSRGARTPPWPPPDITVVDCTARRRGQDLEISCRLEPAPPDPFDPIVCDLRVLLIASEGPDTRRLSVGREVPSGLLRRARPAFHDQSFHRIPEVRNPAEELRPVGQPFYCARIRVPSAAKEPDQPFTALLILNRRLLGSLPMDSGLLAAIKKRKAGLDLGDTLTPPLWTRNGGETFCRVYRPRAEWTGMPWRGEAARYTGPVPRVVEGAPARAKGFDPKAAKSHASRWSYGHFPEKTLCWDPPLEWNAAWGKWQGMGRYDLELCWRFEHVLDRAEREGLSLPLLLTRDGMFFNQGKFRWPMNPWAMDAGGPVEGPGSFFTDPMARMLFQRKLRYLSARYGTSEALGDWLLGACLPAQDVPEWHREMAAYLSELASATGWATTHDRSIAVSRSILSLHPWATAFTKRTRQNSFEAGLWDHVWWKPEQRLSPGTKLKVSKDHASHGKRSAGLSGKFPGQVCLMRELLFAKNETDNFYAYNALIFDVYVPAGAPHDMRAVVHLRDRDELWYETLLDPLLRPGDWTRVVLDVTATNAHGLKPVKHHRPWDDYSRTRIREMGIRIFCGRPYDGEVFLDNIHLAGKQRGRVELKVVPRVTLRKSPLDKVARFGKWEVDFDLNKSYPNPYDPEVVEVYARITSPTGRERVVPAFFYEPYERRLVDKQVWDVVWNRKHERTVKAEEIVPVKGGMAGFWKLRFAPEEEGPHRVVFEVREGGTWKVAKQKWLHDDRFTFEGKALPGRRYHGQFTQIPHREARGRRRVQWIEFTQGPIVTTSKVVRFEATKGEARGFVRRSRDPKFLEHADGSFFYPIGMNLATPSEQQIPFRGGDWNYFRLYDIGHRGTYQYDDYFAAFEKHGLNWAKVWMATWWTALEWRRDWPPYQGVGRYSQPNAWRMDHLVEEARKRDIYLQVILMNHGQVSSGINHDWENSPYNTVLGGPLGSAREFFSEAEAKKLFKNKLRYIAARWGYSTSILDWTLCGEMDFTEEYQTNSFNLYVPSTDKPAPKTMVMWVDEMGDYMKSIDPGRHLISVHLSHPQRGQNIQFAKTLDLVQSNAYSSFPWLAGGRMNVVDAIEGYYYGQEGTHHFKGMKQFGKPVVVCEQGGHWHGISWKYGNWTKNTRESLAAELHCGLWAGILSPMAGQTGYWWWIHVHFDNTYKHYEGAVKFMAGEDLRGKNYRRTEVLLNSSGQPVQALTFHNDKSGYIWVYDTQMPRRVSTRSFAGVQATLPVEPGEYDVEYWHTIKGEILARRTLQTRKRSRREKQHYLHMELPVFAGDVAIKFRKK